MSTQLAAVLLGQGQDFQVQTVERLKPGVGEILIRNHAVATNPMDWIVQKMGIFVKEWNIVIGTDLAGTVEEVGEGVTQWKKGDKVYGVISEFPFGKKGAFQEYSVTSASSVGQIPDNFTFEQAAAFVLPLLTAASSIFSDAKFPHPSPKRPTIAKDAKVFFVNSASSGVGSAAVQLAILCGFRVIGTASPKNFELVKSLGASDVFDYRDPDLVQKVKAAAGQQIEWAYDCAANPHNPTSLANCVQILDGKGTLLSVSPQLPEIDWKDVKVLTAWGSRILTEDGPWWWSFAKAAAEEGSLVPLKPEVMGTKIEDVNKVVAFHSSGQVSGIKPVIKLI